MLVEYLQKVIAVGGDELEIEYRDQKEHFTVFKGSVGFGIGIIDSDKAEPIFKEMKALKKAKRITIGNRNYALHFREFESFGETVYRIHMKEIRSIPKVHNNANIR